MANYVTFPHLYCPWIGFFRGPFSLTLLSSSFGDRRYLTLSDHPLYWCSRVFGLGISSTTFFIHRPWVFFKTWKACFTWKSGGHSLAVEWPNLRIWVFQRSPLWYLIAWQGNFLCPLFVHCWLWLACWQQFSLLICCCLWNRHFSILINLWFLRFIAPHFSYYDVKSWFPQTWCYLRKSCWPNEYQNLSYKNLQLWSKRDFKGLLSSWSLMRYFLQVPQEYSTS